MIKRYKQFVQGRVNENIESDDFSQNDYNNNVSPDDFNDFDDDLDEEEGIDVYSIKLKELASLLGTEVNNGEINYDGKRIIFPSETEMYHVSGKKFKTAEEVVNYININNQKIDNDNEDVINNEGDFSLENEDNFGIDEKELESKSYRRRNWKKS